MSCNVLRPIRFSDLIGQNFVVSSIQTSIDASKITGDVLGHLLLYGPPGLGKTTIAQAIATEVNTNIIRVSAPVLKRPKDLVGILCNLKSRDILFIDEIHRLDKYVQEYLYTAMEDFLIDIIEEGGDCASPITLNLNMFTLVGATTRHNLLDLPFRMRFRNAFELQEYGIDDIKIIINSNAKKLKMNINSDAIDEIASVSRGTPRQVNNILYNLRDISVVSNTDLIDREYVRSYLSNNGIFSLGVTYDEIKILILLEEQKRAIGIASLSNILGKSQAIIETINEPILLKHKLVSLTSRGRVITEKGKRFLLDYSI